MINFHKKTRYIHNLIRACSDKEFGAYCFLKEKKKIEKDIENSLNIKLEDLVEKHSFYVNTTLYSSFYYFGLDYIRINCTYYDDKDKKVHGASLMDNLSVSAYTNEINKWFQSGYN